MSEYTLDVEVDIKKLINKLPLPRKLELVRELERETWAKRLDDVVDKIHRQIRHIPSEEDIRNICKKVRKKVYEKYKSGH